MRNSRTIPAAVVALTVLAGCGGPPTGGAFPSERRHIVLDGYPTEKTVGGTGQSAPGAASPSAFGPDAVDYAGLRLDLIDVDPAVRGEAIWKLAGWKSDPAVDELLAEALLDPDPYVRLEVVEALGYVGDEADHALLGHALQDSTPIVREAAIEALRSIGGPDSAWALIHALDDPEISVREDVIDALHHLGGPIAIALLEEMRLDPDLEIREQVEDALKRTAR